LCLEISKISATVHMKQAEVKNGNTFLKIVKINWKFIPTNLNLKLDNLFNGDKKLGWL